MLEIREFLYDQFVKKEFMEKAEQVLKDTPDAVIAAPVFHQETKDFFDQCKEKGVPFVSVNDNIRHPEQISYVGQDPVRSGAVAAQLMKMGIH